VVEEVVGDVVVLVLDSLLRLLDVVGEEDTDVEIVSVTVKVGASVVVMVTVQRPR
jgi:hypothetical protein